LRQGIPGQVIILLAEDLGLTAGKVTYRVRDVRKSPWVLVICVIIGGLLGGLLGETLTAVFRPGIIQNIFAQALNLGITPPFTVDLWLLKISLGFTLKMNLLTFIGMLLGVFVYKQI
jgi:hypothetical protein